MATQSIDPSVLEHPPSEPVDYSENDDEVDQLASDSDVQNDVANLDASSVSSQKEGEQDGLRDLGQTLLPAVRLENIIQADGVTGNLSMSKEALFVLSIATEEFIRRMSEAAHRQAFADRRSVIHYHDMASTTQQYQEFMFLQETIPYPLPLADALQRREAKERAMLEEDPAISTSLSARPPLAIHPYNSKGKGRSRTVNGKEKLNGSASGFKRERRQRDVNGRWSYSNGDASGEPSVDGVEISWPPCRWADEQSFRPPLPQPIQLGVAPVPPSYLREGEFLPPVQLIAPIQPRNEQADCPSTHPYNHHHPTFHPQDEVATWPGQYTGPASGFLQPNGPFGHVPQNPGRTIYSPQHPAEPGHR